MPALAADHVLRLERLEQVVAALEETERTQPSPPDALREALAAFRAERDTLRRLTA